MSEHVVVIGAGVFGAWTAMRLLRAGHRVTLIDAEGPAHSRASSGGESRLIRAAYGPDSVYSRMALDSLEEWKALSAVSGLPILHQCGILFFFPTEQRYVSDTIAVHRSFGLPTEVLDRAAMARRFPMIDFEGVEIGLFEPDFGVLMARRAVQTLVADFARQGGLYVRALANPPQVRNDALHSVALASGEELVADRFVFALGPWLGTFFPDIVGRRILPTRQEIF